jgi:predicted enzyme related to lactoylglutathione lyase
MAPGMSSGHFMTDLAVAVEAGVRPYIFVDRADKTLEKVVAHGGAVVTAPIGRATCG